MTDTTTSPQQVDDLRQQAPAPRPGAAAPRRARATHAWPGLALLHRPGGPRPRAGADLRPGPGRSSAHESDLPNPGSRVVGKLGTHRGRRGADGERGDPRPRQHVPPPRHPAGRRAGRGEGAPLPVPRLDLPPGRPARRRPRGAVDPMPRQDQAGVVPGPGRGGVRPGLRQPRPRRPSRWLRSSTASSRCSSATSPAPLEQFDDYRLHVDDPKDSAAANWKVVVDNYLEGYHVPVAHPGLMRLLDYKQYAVTTVRHLRRCTRRRSARSRRTTGRSGCTSGSCGRCRACCQEDERVFRYVAIYPNTVIDLYPDHVLVWKMNPAGVDGTGVPGAYLRRKHMRHPHPGCAVAEPADQPDHDPRGRGPGRHACSVA